MVTVLDVALHTGRLVLAGLEGIISDRGAGLAFIGLLASEATVDLAPDALILGTVQCLKLAGLLIGVAVFADHGLFASQAGGYVTENTAVL